MRLHSVADILWRNKEAVLLFVLALLVRTVYLVEIQANHNPDLYSPLDQMENRYWARSILTGDILGEHAAFPEDVFYRNGVFFKPPLYPYLLALALKVGGGSLLFAAVLQVVISSLSCALLLPLALRLGMSRAVGLIGALALCFCGPHVFLCGQLLSETVYIAVVLWLLLALLGFRDRPSGGRAVAVGLLCGACVLLRPNILAFVPFAAGWLWVVLKKDWGRGRILGWGAIGLAGLALCVLPITLRNVAVGGDKVILAYYGGYNFFAGNNEKCQHGTAYHDMTAYHDRINQATQNQGRVLRASEISGLGWSMGRAFVSEQPGKYLGMLGNKLYRTFNAYEMMSNQSPYHMGRYSTVLGVLTWRAGPVGFPMGLWGPLGLLGMAWAIHRRQGLLGIFYILASTVGLLAFFVTFRHRLPMVPVFYIFAAYGAVTLIRMLRREPRKGFLLIMVLVVLVIVVNSNADGLDPDHYDRLARKQLIRSYLNQAASACEVGDYQEAGAVLARGIAATDEDVARVSLAFILSTDPERAARDGRRAVGLLTEARDQLGATVEYHFARAFTQAETGDHAGAVGTMNDLQRAFAENRDPEHAAVAGELVSLFRNGWSCRLAENSIDRELQQRYAPKWEVYLPPWNIRHPARDLRRLLVPDAR